MHTEQGAPPAARYEDDLVEWLTAQAAALRAGRWADIDVEHLAEEIDGLAGSDRREVRKRLRVLIAHILKTIHQPERQSDFARRDAARQTRLSLKRFPEELPKEIGQRVMDVLAETA